MRKSRSWATSVLPGCPCARQGFFPPKSGGASSGNPELLEWNGMKRIYNILMCTHFRNMKSMHLEPLSDSGSVVRRCSWWRARRSFPLLLGGCGHLRRSHLGGTEVSGQSASRCAPRGHPVSSREMSVCSSIPFSLKYNPFWPGSCHMPYRSGWQPAGDPRVAPTAPGVLPAGGPRLSFPPPPARHTALSLQYIPSALRLTFIFIF